jgi:hypothetical protein
MKNTSVSPKKPLSDLSQRLGAYSIRGLSTALIFALLFVFQGVKAQAQYAIGVSAIAANPMTVDTYSSTELDALANYYYDPYVEGYLYRKYFTSLNWDLIRSGSAFGGSVSNIADGYMSAPTEVRSRYQHESDHYVVSYYYTYQPCCGYTFYNPAGYGFASNDGTQWPSGYQFLPGPAPVWVQRQYHYLGTTAVTVAVSPPAIEAIQPTAAQRGQGGVIQMYGSYMSSAYQAQFSGSGATASVSYVSENQANIQFNINSTAATGVRQLSLTNQFGTSNQVDFLIADPTPVITGISPGAWEVGAQTQVIITGRGFGTRPLVNITGTGITITVTLATDTEIRANFSIDNNAAEGPRIVTVTSQGYGSNPFIPDPGGNSTPNSNGVNFNVATPIVTFKQFNSVLEGGERTDLNVRVDSIVPNRQVEIKLRTAQGGQGDARFTNDSTTMTVSTGVTDIGVKGIRMSSAADNISLVAEFGPKKFEEKFTVASLSLKEVTFSGNRTLRKDDNSGDYTGPHWVDNSSTPDGDADDFSDIKYPVAYVKNNTVTAGIKVVAVPDVSLDGARVKIQGKAFSILNFPEQTVTAGASDHDISVGGFVSDSNLSTTVDFFDPLSIVWEYQPKDDVSWLVAGVSSNQVYVTWAPPVPVSPFFHTLAHIACEPAKGANTSTDIFNAIWGLFASKSLSTADGTKPLNYYNPKDTQNTIPAKLIAAGNGQCGSFAGLLIDALRVHGITSLKFPMIDRNDTTLSRTGFLVKKWSFTTDPGKSGDSEYPYLNVISDQVGLFVDETYFSAVHSYSYNQATDIEGIDGQGSLDPSSIFNNHQFVEHTIGAVTNWYDPSYGVIYSGLTEADRLSSFQEAIDGLYRIRQISVSEAAIDRDLNDNGTKTDVLLLWCLLTKKKPSGTFTKRGDITWGTP